MIREALLFGLLLYLGITVLQVLAVGALSVEALLLGVLLLAATLAFWIRGEAILHRIETAVLWGGIFLFAGYALAKLGGWI
jgi:hypothetical protein